MFVKRVCEAVQILECSFRRLADAEHLSLASSLALKSLKVLRQGVGRTNLKALQPGELFLFKLHAPRNFIVGGGVFARADNRPTSLAWEAFAATNGS